MKQVAVGALAIVGAFAVWRWFSYQRTGRPRGQGAHNMGPYNSTGRPVQSSLSAVTSGVPAFVKIPVEAGHGDQQAAAVHSNALSTSNGAPNYTPAFGPNENQGD